MNFKKLNIFFILIHLFLPVFVYSQFKTTEKPKEVPKPDFYKWKFGVGMNIVDDKGTRFLGIFRTQENWNALPYPSRFSVERHLEEKFSIGMVLTLNKYKEGKNVSGVHITEEQDYFALDAEFKYFFNKETGNRQWFDPYILSGVGLSWIDHYRRPTFNGGFGFNFWFPNEQYKKPGPQHFLSGAPQKKHSTKEWVKKHIGFNIQTIGKVCVDFQYFDNQIQHSFGLILRL